MILCRHCRRAIESTERDGRLIWFHVDTTRPAPWRGFRTLCEDDEGELLDSHAAPNEVPEPPPAPERWWRGDPEDMLAADMTARWHRTTYDYRLSESLKVSWYSTPEAEMAQRMHELIDRFTLTVSMRSHT